ncbi:M36 family metallopeptidase [Myxococcus landrumensis]|uniref:M36 family metallopeptidase n=1 Tax=Myxococcus landrumensis TaxID=2813577 RepID=A0ABX7N6S0_9BACT|nr:M36 family metallopeptidase [Myxococcus landrumus]QSQ14435.1 M36 family metallopeptidase [Myxococcus landrumus]
MSVGAYRRRLFQAVVFTATLTGSTAMAVSPESSGERHFDARVSYNAQARFGFSAAQKARVEQLRQSVPELRVELDEHSGTVRSLSNPVGALSGPSSGDPMAIGLDFVQKHHAALGLELSDLASLEVTDRVYSDVSGATHLYLRQTYKGLPVYNAQLQINVGKDGSVLGVHSDFLPSLDTSIAGVEPRLSAGEAVAGLARHLGVRLADAPRSLKAESGSKRRTAVEVDGLSREPIVAELAVLPIRRGEARLVWHFQVHTLDSQHDYDVTVDAGSGEVLTRFDWVAADSYKVYPAPVESPNHVSPLPPSDGRSTLTNPANATASPYGWHDTNGVAGAEYTIPRGNNVHAYEDRDANNAPPTTGQPDCGAAINCVFPINLSAAPSTYIPAAVTNLFYWNNVIHDVQYQYGFNEAGGNFQQNNYGRGGVGNDYVQAEAQDGSGTNNANFSTPADGSRPRMQMYIWTAPTPDKDGDLDTGIIVHEYGHGISNRLVGGPSNVSCLTNRQQPGEGISDFLALFYTARTTDTANTIRGMGTYALNQATNGTGIRGQPYTMDSARNTWTFQSLRGMAVPHGVGSVFAQGMWEAYWALVTQWGFDSNLYNANGNAGNQRMMLYFTEGMKRTGCRPTFLMMRDGIINAATTLHGGEDVCRLWRAFAAYGMGTNATTTGPDDVTAATNGFAVPSGC